MASIKELNSDEILKQILDNQSDSDGPSENFVKVTRVPFLIGRQSSSPEDYLSFWINPSQCGWKVGLRTTIEKVAGGAIHHEWPTTGIGTQPTGMILDHPVISFSFQSGAIYPGAHEELSVANKSTVPRKAVPEGLGNFYDFLEILSESNITAEGEPNYVNIFYTSNIFPSMWLQGFFTEDGVAWDDSADNPNTISSWGASFMVFNSMPDLADAQTLRNHFKKFGFKAFGLS